MAVGHFGSSYVGLIFLLMLFIPNIIWARNKPRGYTADGENRVLLAFLLLGVYGRVVWMVASAVLLGIGHIGIHAGHSR